MAVMQESGFECCFGGPGKGEKRLLKRFLESKRKMEAKAKEIVIADGIILAKRKGGISHTKHLDLACLRSLRVNQHGRSFLRFLGAWVVLRFLGGPVLPGLGGPVLPGWPCIDSQLSDSCTSVHGSSDFA